MGDDEGGGMYSISALKCIKCKCPFEQEHSQVYSVYVLVTFHYLNSFPFSLLIVSFFFWLNTKNGPRILYKLILIVATLLTIISCSISERAPFDLAPVFQRAINCPVDKMYHNNIIDMLQCRLQHTIM